MNCKRFFFCHFSFECCAPRDEEATMTMKRTFNELGLIEVRLYTMDIILYVYLTGLLWLFITYNGSP